MKHLCAKCNVCEHMPDQEGDRDLFLLEERSSVLVIDDAWGADHTPIQRRLDALFPEGVAYTYTSTVRCKFSTHEVSPEWVEVSVQRCAVWTHLLMDNRSVVITTPYGLRQMGLEVDRKPGDMFKSAKVGVVLVIPPIVMMSGKDVVEYQPRVKRVLREVGLVT